MVERQDIYSNFTGGQYSPFLAGRYDSPLYKFGVESAKNVIFRPQGGFSRRPGTNLVETVDPGSRLISLDVSDTTKSYVIAIEPGADIKILEFGTIVKTISHGIPRGGQGVKELSYDKVRNLIIFALKDMAPKVLRAPTTTSYSGDGITVPFPTNFPYFNSSSIIVRKNGIVQTLTTHYTVAQPQKIGGQYSSATITFLTAPTGFDDITITRDWEYVDYPALDGPWESENLGKSYKIQTTGGTADTTNGTYSGTCTLTAVKKKGGSGAWFDNNWVGRKMRIYQDFNNALAVPDDEENWGVVTINSVTTTNQVFSATIDTDFPLIFAGTAKGPWRRWRLSAWYTGNYPEVVSFHEGRLYFLRGSDRWTTVSDDLFTLSPDTISVDDLGVETYTVTDDSAIYYKSGDSNSSTPQFAISHQVLHVGTGSSYLTVSSSGRSLGASSNNISESKEASIGVAPIRPILYDALYFVDSLRQNLYKASYKVRANSWLPEKINNYDSEILHPKIKTMALVTKPFAMIWCVMDDGTVRVCSINDIDSIYTWSILEYPSLIWDIAVVKSTYDSEDIYLITEDGKILRSTQLRTAAGIEETVLTYFPAYSFAEESYHSYSEIVQWDYQTDENTTYLSGSLNLATLTGGVRAVDALTYKQYKEGTGNVTVTNSYEIGKPFFAEVILRPISLTTQAETNLLKDKSFLKVGFNVWRTQDFKIKEKSSSYDTSVSLRDGTSDPFEPVIPYTGAKEVKGIGTSKDSNIQLKIYQTECTPLNVNSVIISYDEG